MRERESKSVCLSERTRERVKAKGVYKAECMCVRERAKSEKERVSDLVCVCVTERQRENFLVYE